MDFTPCHSFYQPVKPSTMKSAHGRRGEELPLLSSMEISSDDVDVFSVASSADTIRIGNKNEQQAHPLKGPTAAACSTTTDANNTNSEAHHHHGTGTVLETALNSAKTCLGTGTLALPYAASQGGYLFNVLGLILISLWNLWSVKRLIHCGELVRELHGDQSEVHQQHQGHRVRHESRTSRHRRTGSSMRKLYRGMITDANINDDEVQWSEEKIIAEQSCPPEGTSTYGSVAWYALGPIGLHIMDVALLVLLLGVVIAYEDAIISFIRETPVTSGSAALDSLATVLIIAPLTCVEDLHFLSKTSAVRLVETSVALTYYYRLLIQTNLVSSSFSFLSLPYLLMGLLRMDWVAFGTFPGMICGQTRSLELLIGLVSRSLGLELFRSPSISWSLCRIPKACQERPRSLCGLLGVRMLLLEMESEYCSSRQFRNSRAMFYRSCRPHHGFLQ